MRIVLSNLCVVFIFVLISADAFASNHELIGFRIEKLNQQIIIYENDPALLVKRGKLYLELDQFEPAIADFQHAIKVDPTFSKAVYLLGSTFLTVEAFEEAKIALNVYLKIQPRDVVGLETYAQTLVKLNAFSDAAKYYDQAIMFNRTPSIEIYLDRAKALMQVEPLPMRYIEKGLKVGLRKHGPTLSYFELLVEANLKVENDTKALYWVDQIPESIRNNPTWLIKRAQIYEYQGENLLAIQQYKKLLHKIGNLTREQQKAPAMLEARNISRQEIARLKRHF